MWRVRTTDDRQRPIHLVRFAPWEPLRLRSSTQPAESVLIRLALVPVRVGHFFVRYPQVLIGLMATGLLIVLAAMALSRGTGVLGLLLFSPIAISLIFAIMQIAAELATVPGRRGERTKRLCLKRGMCPACRYAMLIDRPEPDGCVVCSECGAAWSTERIARAISNERKTVVIHEWKSDEPTHKQND